MPPSAELHAEVADTVNRFLELAIPDYLLAALNAYRRGCIAATKEEQFISFFRAVELVAEHKMEKRRTPIQCSACRANLICQACGDPAMRTPFGRLAVDALIEDITGRADPKLSKILFGFRNGLTHGRRTSSMEKEFGVSAEECLERIALLAWTAMSSELGPQCSDWNSQYFATFGSVVVPVLQVRAVGAMTQTSAGPFPTEAEIPNATMILETSFTGPFPPRAAMKP